MRKLLQKKAAENEPFIPHEPAVNLIERKLENSGNPKQEKESGIIQGCVSEFRYSHFTCKFLKIYNT